jgi:plastocyanin
MLIPILLLASPLLLQEQQATAQLSAQNSSNQTTSGAAPSGHSDIDVTPIVAVIIIGKDKQGNVAYIPNNVTINVGEEIFVLNNDTMDHSMTSGSGPQDPMTGKLFDTGAIKPKGFVEYVASNLSPGNYPFYSINSPSTTGLLKVK